MFRVDVEIDGVPEDEEEDIGAFAAVAPCDDDCTNSFSRAWMLQVKIKTLPDDRPDDEKIDLTFLDKHLWELLDDGTFVKAEQSYQSNEIGEKKFRLHGHAKSSAARDRSVKASLSANGCNDTAKYTVVTASRIDVVPQNWPTNAVYAMSPARIGAGGVTTPAHCADVTLQLSPAWPAPPKGVSIPARLIGGLGHEPGKEAVLSLDGLLMGDGEWGSATFYDGVATGVLLSSDVDSMTCSIQAGDFTDGATKFTWDEVEEDGEWVTDLPFLPASGVVNHTLTLRHHRDGSENEPYEPFTNHEIMMFVEELTYWENGVLKGEYNFPENPKDLSAFAYFPDVPTCADGGGKVTIPLTIMTNCLESVKVVAYDCSVYKPTDNGYQTMSMALGGFQLLKAQQLTDAERIRNMLKEFNMKSLKPYIAFFPQYVPVVGGDDQVVEFKNDKGKDLFYGGICTLFVRDDEFENVKTTFFNKENGIWLPVSTDIVDWVGHQKIKMESPYLAASAIPGNMTGWLTFIDLCSKQYFEGHLRARKPGMYMMRVEIGGRVFTKEFTAVATQFEFINKPLENKPLPVLVTSDDTDYAVFPLYSPPSTSVFMNHRIKVTKVGPGGTLNKLTRVFTPAGFPGIGMNDIQGLEFDLSPTSEKDGRLNGIFEFSAQYEVQSLVFSTQNFGKDLEAIYPSLVFEDKTTYGSVNPLHLICADVHIASPHAGLPATGEDGKSATEATHSVFIFDRPSENDQYKGKCSAICELPDFELSEEAETIVREALEWEAPKKDGITDVTGEAVPNKPGDTNFVYAAMPELNNDYGNSDPNTPLRLYFKERKNDWKWEQDVQFRFYRTGTGATMLYAENPAYQKIFPSNIEIQTINNNPNITDKYPTLDKYPNWYFYWHQATGESSGPKSGPFHCQAQKMYYHSSEQCDGDGNPDLAGALGVYYFQTSGNSYRDRIVIYNCNKEGIVEFAGTLHHENGHEQTRKFEMYDESNPPKPLSGFGAGGRNLANDQDGDGIPDHWEKDSEIGKELGFQIQTLPLDLNTPAGAQWKNERKWYANWQHGWTTKDDMMNKSDGDINRNGWIDNENGSGLPIRNEQDVDAKATDLKARDWSHYLQDPN